MSATVDWNRIRLVVFDVDGTLYRQRPVRLRMARDLALFSLHSRSLHVAKVLRTFRDMREQLAEAETEDFLPVLCQRTAAACRCTLAEVKAIVDEWIGARPLPYVAAARYPDLDRVLSGMRRAGKLIGVFSDYPPAAKLGVLDVSADFVVSAEDDDVRWLKPHPRGLEVIMAKAGVGASETCLIGDRIERDGLAARRAGAACLIRSERQTDGWQSFKGYGDPVFSRFL